METDKVIVNSAYINARKKSEKDLERYNKITNYFIGHPDRAEPNVGYIRDIVNVIKNIKLNLLEKKAQN